MDKTKDRLLATYHTLLDQFGPQHWWPGDTPFEIMVGAVLTQNTNWGNVRRAIETLKQDNLLSLEILYSLPIELLAEKIRPSGYYNLKARRLRNLLTLIQDKYHGDLALFFSKDLPVLRKDLLSVKGIGPETADSILLYAAKKPTFVVDTYTHRILSRHGLVPEEADYQEIQDLFISSLPEDTDLYNEYHALIVRLGKEFCKKNNPLCGTCPIEGY